MKMMSAQGKTWEREKKKKTLESQWQATQESGWRKWAKKAVHWIGAKYGGTSTASDRSDVGVRGGVLEESMPSVGKTIKL